MQTNYVALAIVIAYMAALGGLTSIVQRSVTNTTTFTSGKRPRLSTASAMRAPAFRPFSLD